MSNPIQRALSRRGCGTAALAAGLAIMTAWSAAAAGSGAPRPVANATTVAMVKRTNTSKPAKVAKVAATKAAAEAPVDRAAAPAGADSARTPTREALKGDAEGTVFRSLTVEGENRVHYDYERPALDLDLDPARAPGLTWGDARDVLDRSKPDLTAPFLAASANAPCEALGRPWLESFIAGPVARFRPQLEEVERWILVVADARGREVARFEGRGTPPREIAWDGRTAGGGIVVPGLTYSYVVEAWDQAGNRRHFVGEGFQVPAFRLETAEGPVLAFAGRALESAPGASRAARPVPAVLLESASWINQSESGRPLRVTATARTGEQADALAALVMQTLSSRLAGDPNRLQPVVRVEPDAPEGGTVTIAPAGVPPRPAAPPAGRAGGR